MITDKELGDMEARCAASTPGPWLERRDDDYYQGGTYLKVGGYKYHYGKKVPGNEFFEVNMCRMESNDVDKNFISFARTDVPRLIEEVKRLTSAYKECESNLAEAVESLEEIILMADLFGSGYCVPARKALAKIRGDK